LQSDSYDDALDVSGKPGRFRFDDFSCGGMALVRILYSNVIFTPDSVEKLSSCMALPFLIHFALLARSFAYDGRASIWSG